MVDIILRHPKIELQYAEAAIMSMEKSSSLPELEKAWVDFLTYLERVWIKTEGSCKQFKKFQPWQGQYQRLRRKDMLLRYLKAARDATTHTLQESTKIQPGYTAMRFTNPNGGYIERLEVVGGRVVHYKGDPIAFHHQPTQPIVVAIKNNGESFNPPTIHMGITIKTSNPVDLAKLGLAFYQKFVSETEKTFFSSANQ